MHFYRISVNNQINNNVTKHSNILNEVGLRTIKYRMWINVISVDITPFYIHYKRYTIQLPQIANVY